MKIKVTEEDAIHIYEKALRMRAPLWYSDEPRALIRMVTSILNCITIRTARNAILKWDPEGARDGQYHRDHLDRMVNLIRKTGNVPPLVIKCPLCKGRGRIEHLSKSKR